LSGKNVVSPKNKKIHKKGNSDLQRWSSLPVFKKLEKENQEKKEKREKKQYGGLKESPKAKGRRKEKGEKEEKEINTQKEKGKILKNNYLHKAQSPIPELQEIEEYASSISSL
jgi:hypothetical protein